MAKSAYPDLAATDIVRNAPKLGAALLTGAFLLSGLAAEPAHAKNGRGLAIGVGAFGLGVLMSEASRAENHGGYNDDDDDDYRENNHQQKSYREKSYRKESKSRSTPSRSSAPVVQFSQEMLETQKSLNQAGFDAGTEDGVGGPQTTAAIKAFQSGQGYPETGRLTPAQLKRLYVVASEVMNARDGGGAQEVDTTGDASLRTTSLEQDSYKPKFGYETLPNETKIVAGHENTRQTVPEPDIDPSTLEVEKALFSLQLIKTMPDGKMDDETVAGIKEYQSHFNQSPTGELSTEQRAHLMTLVKAYFSFEKN
jgi:peptidoglycan hydrolase-like protein with peptidoglycan-binding domain